MASSMAGKSGFPGEPIGSGRAADVYALDAERVLRRYRMPYSCTAEGRIWLAWPRTGSKTLTCGLPR